MSEYTESNTTNELLDYLGQDCEWAAECVRSRYNSLKRERAEVEAELAELREIIRDRNYQITCRDAELAALKEAAQAEVDRQRHQCGILRQELQPTTAALASLL